MKRNTKAPRRTRQRRTVCYFHDVADGNETPYDPRRHHICLICGVKLWELARDGLQFEMRSSCVCVQLEPLTVPRRVVLSTGYEVDLDDADGLEHLFNAVFGESFRRLRCSREFGRRGFEVVHDVCICELHYIAGQLHSQGSALDFPFLLDQFGVQWDRLAERINRDAGENGKE